jgi:hypothetical protein
MNAYARMSLINEIAVKLQQEMNTTDINVLLAGYGILNTGERIVPSKRIFVQDKLSNLDDSIILIIARDSGIDISQYKEHKAEVDDEQNVWIFPYSKKIFISHIAREKEKAAKIQYHLLKNKISSFVAHEDIEPSLDWQSTILAALISMDILVALVTPGFHNSYWTNQEVGFAIGKNTPVISVKIGDDPKGFIGRFQAIPGKGRYPKDIVSDIMRIMEKQ